MVLTDRTREGMVGKEEKEDSSERQWEGSGVKNAVKIEYKLREGGTRRLETLNRLRCDG